MRGGEKVFEVLCEIFPDADVFTLVYEPDRVSPLIRSMNVRMPWLMRHSITARRHYRWLLPVLPSIAESLPIKGYDLVVSSSHCVAKGIVPDPPETPHICYCFTPMRYVWDKYEDYVSGAGPVKRLAMGLARRPLQKWDAASSVRVNQFITSSDYVRDRIRHHYSREALVIPPPVNCHLFGRAERVPEDFFLVVSALEPYKRVDLVVEAFRFLGLPLKVVGSGTELERLKRRAPTNIEFLGWASDDDLVSLYSRARALVFPTDEDFGIVPLEACAAGCPVIAFAKGGALETMVENETALFFKQQTVDSLAEAVGRFDPSHFREENLRARAQEFDRPIFKERLSETIRNLCGLPIPRHPTPARRSGMVAPAR